MSNWVQNLVDEWTEIGIEVKWFFPSILWGQFLFVNFSGIFPFRFSFFCVSILRIEYVRTLVHTASVRTSSNKSKCIVSVYYFLHTSGALTDQIYYSLRYLFLHWPFQKEKCFEFWVFTSPDKYSIKSNLPNPQQCDLI